MLPNLLDAVLQKNSAQLCHETAPRDTRQVHSITDQTRSVYVHAMYRANDCLTPHHSGIEALQITVLTLRRALPTAIAW